MCTATWQLFHGHCQGFLLLVFCVGVMAHSTEALWGCTAVGCLRYGAMEVGTVPGAWGMVVFGNWHASVLSSLLGLLCCPPPGEPCPPPGKLEALLTAGVALEAGSSQVAGPHLRIGRADRRLHKTESRA